MAEARSLAVRNLDLLPFVAVAGVGIHGLVGWWTGQATWVQPRITDLPFAANAAVCFFLLGIAPLLQRLGRPQLAAGVSLSGAGLALLALAEAVLQTPLGIANLFVNHSAVVDGSQVGRLPLLLAIVLVVCGLALTWRAVDAVSPQRQRVLALAGSLAGAYGFAALAAAPIGLAQASFWQELAQLGPIAAAGTLTLGLALVLLAARDSARAADGSGARWLWLPIVTGGTTVTLLFWVALREREIGYLNSVTQLTINNIAAVFSRESETQINSLRRMAERWTDAGGTAQPSWEKDAQGLADDQPAYRSISWVDGNLRTRWIWPRIGNEDAPTFDHSLTPERAKAMTEARQTLTFAIAAPLSGPLQAPTFAAYATVLRNGAFDGFIVGELSFQRLFETIDERLNVSPRYILRVSVATPSPTGGVGPNLEVFESRDKEPPSNQRLRQTAVYNLLGQRITFDLVPRSRSLATDRQFLPEVVLAAGLFLSLLLGLVVNLAQAARLRQAAAETTSAQLLAENEERRRVEDQLKVADDRLNLALEATQVGVLEWSLADGSAIFSAGFWNSLGYDSATMPAEFGALTRLAHPADLPAYEASLAAHLGGRSDLVEAEFRVRDATGIWRWLSLRAKCVGTDRIGRPRRMSGTCQDITARKRAEEELRASQAATRKLSLVASSTDNAVIITGPDGRVEWVNESFSRLTGLALEEVAGRPFHELLSSPETETEAVERVAAAFARHEGIATDVVHVARGGRRYHVHLQMQPLRSEEGLLENFIVMETDITSRVEVEQQLRRAKSEADSASRAKSDFLASMSHEIRTPMNGVIGMTSLLNETELTPEQRDYVQTIRTSGDALLSIINEILDFSKIESGRMELEQQPFELAQCVEEALDIFALQAAGKGIELAYLVEPDVPVWVTGDITRLRQILVNLVNNAVKFTAKGAITVTVRRSERSLPSGGPALLEFAVADSGIGIPLDRLDALFKPFSQVDSSTTRKYGGTGLGLAICARLVQLMGGSIHVDSRPGAGSTFLFSICVDPAEPQFSEPARRFDGATVLIAAGLPVNRRALEIATIRWGCQAASVNSEEDLLRIAQPPSLAIVDHAFAGVKGGRLATALRERFPRLPIILLTSANEAARQGAGEDQLVVRLPKPIKPSFLGEAAARLLDGLDQAGAAPRPAVEIALAERVPLDVLLVEDNPVNQKVALHLLARLGYRADAVGNGIEAVKAVVQRRYDVVFMDVQMPEMDGYAATREIRNRIAPARQPRIIALTANAVQGDREKCIDAGMNDYIAKPVKIDDIEAVILRHFPTLTGA